MNYVVGTLEMFRTVVNDLRKEDELCDIVNGIMHQVQDAVANRRKYIVVESSLFDQVSDQFLIEGYTVDDIDNGTKVRLSGWYE